MAPKQGLNGTKFFISFITLQLVLKIHEKLRRMGSGRVAATAAAAVLNIPLHIAANAIAKVSTIEFYAS
jgi:hypothetical protein